MADFLEELATDLAALEFRPYDFAYWGFPWGEPGTELENRKGLEKWQAKVLLDLQEGLITAEEAWRIAVRSGHGVGKSALLCIIILWAISTKVDTRGRVTANTEKQLSRTLWPELGKWFRMFIARDLFKLTATAIHSADPQHEKTWRIDAIPWSEDNPEAFAGLHNYGKRILVVQDEASGIIDKIWEVLDGATLDADTQIIWIATGNPTKNYGRFRDCFDKRLDEWHTYHVDSREVSFTNKKQIDRAIERFGADSDYVKVRYLGEFPDAASTQLFPAETIRHAQALPPVCFPTDAFVIGVDVARFGKNESVIAFRRGKDAKSIPAQRFRGLTTIELGDKVAALINEHHPDAVFIDEGGVGGGVVDYVRSLGHNVIGVNFGGKPGIYPQGIRVANKRAEMYVSLLCEMRSRLAIEADEDLYDQLVAIEYYIRDKQQDIILVSKEDMEADGIESPDWADALALTFAFPVSVRQRLRGPTTCLTEYDPYSQKAAEEYA